MKNNQTTTEARTRERKKKLVERYIHCASCGGAEACPGTYKDILDPYIAQEKKALLQGLLDKFDEIDIELENEYPEKGYTPNYQGIVTSELENLAHSQEDREGKEAK